MNLMMIKEGLTGAYNISKLYVKDHAPQILMGVAIGSELGAIGTSCYAMTKMTDILDNHKMKMDEAKALLENNDISNDEYQEAATKIYVDTGIATAKVWALPVMLTGLSITAGLAAYGVINKKYVGAMASLATVTDKFKNYRYNVIEDVGRERDKIYLDNGICKAKVLRLKKKNTHNGTEEPYTDKEINEAMGTDTPDKKLMDIFVPTNNPYAFEWSRDTVIREKFNEHSHLYNVQYVTAYQIAYWNNRLQTDGVVTLNQVLKGLGLIYDMSAEFDDIGWCKKKYDERCDGFIDFGFDKSTSINPSREMWRDISNPEMEAEYKANPDADRVILVMNCCDIREAKKKLYGEFFGKGGKLEAKLNGEYC